VGKDIVSGSDSKNAAFFVTTLERLLVASVQRVHGIGDAARDK